MNFIAKYMILAGILLVISGLLIGLAGNKLNWLGNLPGDLKIETENIKFYFPLTTMILISLLLSGFVWLLKKTGFFSLFMIFIM